MGNTESAMVQKRLERFRPEERPVVEGVFDRLLVGAGAPSGPPGTTLTLEMLQVRPLPTSPPVLLHYITCHLADAFIQSDLQ